MVQRKLNSEAGKQAKASNDLPNVLLRKEALKTFFIPTQKGYVIGNFTLDFIKINTTLKYFYSRCYYSNPC